LPHAFLIVGLVGSALGLLFSAVSAYDFVAHLDRQVHGLHCSFLPGLGTPDVSGTTGCALTMMSPYSSIFRESIWGGIPIALPAMAVFAFLLFWGCSLWFSGRIYDRRAAGFYVTATMVPLVASLVMGTVAVRELDVFCKLCVGIYVASVLCVIGAFMTYRRAEREGDRLEHTPLSWGALIFLFALGCLFVGSTTAAYALKAPDFTRFVGACGKLEQPADPQHALLAFGNRSGSTALIEVLDPLCPACRAFERRFDRMALARSAKRDVLLFPLDNSCNWMVDQAVHPGACAISEALLCASDQAEEVLAWAFKEQENIVAAERADKGSAAKMVTRHFPVLAGCVGSSKARARLNKALRWAVDNKLPVLTPQLYVEGRRLCDADTDLGLDYMLTRLTSLGSRAQGRASTPAPAR
jgi:Vitamin K epoxide reductase family/Thioredoxin